MHSTSVNQIVMEKGVEKESCFIFLDESMKENGIMTSDMEEDMKYTPIIIPTQENLQMGKLMAMAFTNGAYMKSMMDNGREV